MQNLFVKFVNLFPLETQNIGETTEETIFAKASSTSKLPKSKWTTQTDDANHCLYTANSTERVGKMSNDVTTDCAWGTVTLYLHKRPRGSYT